MSLPSEPRLLLATRSQDKVREVRQILSVIRRVHVLSLDDLALAPDPDEDAIEIHDTFLANARAKANYFLRRSGMPTLAEDSGLCVDALGGQPGVRSRRFAHVSNLRGTDVDRANNEQLLAALRNIPAERRAAHYTCALALHLPDGRRTSVVAARAGRILEAPQGKYGFGYDPIFLDLASGLSFGETDPAMKNTTSHRARAIRALAANFPSRI